MEAHYFIIELAYLAPTPRYLNNSLYFLNNKPLVIFTDPLKYTLESYVFISHK